MWFGNNRSTRMNLVQCTLGCIPIKKYCKVANQPFVFKIDNIKVTKKQYDSKSPMSNV